MESWLGTCDLGSTSAPALYTTPSSPESGVCVLALSQKLKKTYLPCVFVSLLYEKTMDCG